MITSVSKKVISLSCCALSGIIFPIVLQARQKQPNFIFILTDDHRADAIGYAGNKIIQTPEMDKLASQGAWFKNAFVTTPISAASRASILTGMYERSHDYTFQKGPLKQPYVDIMYPVVLRENGYYTGFFGKLGVDIHEFKSYFDQADFYDRNSKYPDKRGYFYKIIGNDTVHLTRFAGYQAQEFIKQVPAGKPFCLSLSFSAPHAHDNAKEQYFWQEKSNKRYADITIPPASMTEDRYFRQLPEEVQKGYNRVRWHWRYDTPEKYQQSIKGYYRLISEIDDEIGELRQLLEEMKLGDNTVIIIMGDNGLFTGERQLAGKWLMHELSIRVPLIIYDPRLNKHQDVESAALNIDIPKTILAMAHVPVPAAYQGVSLEKQLKKGNVDTGRDAILFEHLWKIPEIPSSEGIRTDRWKYFRYRFITAPEEMYDLKNDPDEKINLAQNPCYKKQVDKLRDKLEREIKHKISQKLLPEPTEPWNKNQ